MKSIAFVAVPRAAGLALPLQLLTEQLFCRNEYYLKTSFICNNFEMKWEIEHKLKINILHDKKRRNKLTSTDFRYPWDTINTILLDDGTLTEEGEKFRTNEQFCSTLVKNRGGGK